MPATAKIGEIPTAFVAFFGMPAVFGLTLGQFIADLGLESSPLVMITPAVSFLGLLGVYYARRASTLAGCIAYIAITSLWLSFMLPAVNGIPTVVAAYSALAGQSVAVIVGYLAYQLVVKRILPKKDSSTQH
jgi:uncharacterized membrane protein